MCAFLPGSGITYFIQGEQTKLVKIGKTRDSCPCKRCLSCQTGSPDKLIVLGFLVGDKEKELHNRFKMFWSHGEWFYPEPELLEFIRQNTSKTKCDCVSAVGYTHVNGPTTLGGGKIEAGGSAEQNRHNKHHRNVTIVGCKYCQKRNKWSERKKNRRKKRQNRARNSRISTIYGKKAFSQKITLDNPLG